jgi:hypothetical protein
MDADEAQIRQQREKFIKAFDDLAEATSNLVAISKKQVELVNKQIEVTNGLIETMMLPKDGMRDVIDEVIGEIQGLREDLRIMVKAGGLQTTFSALFGGRKSTRT